MENRTARLTLLIDPRKKKIFEEICALHDVTPSQVVRKLIRQWIIENAAGRELPPWLLRASAASAEHRGRYGSCPVSSLGVEAILAVVAGWLVLGLAGLFALHRFWFVARVLFPAGGALALALVGISLAGLHAPAESVVLPIGLPSLPFHFRLDSFSAFFILAIAAVAAGVSAFAAGYFRRGEGTPPGLLCLQYHVFLASGHGARGACRRRLRVHGDVGNDGAVVVLPRDDEPPHPRDQERGLPVSPDRAHRGDRHPPVLRRPAGGHRRLHVREHARPAARAVLVIGGVPAGLVRLRGQGRCCRCTCGCPKRILPRLRRCPR